MSSTGESFEPTGEFRVRDWLAYRPGFCFITIGEKIERAPLKETYRRALELMLAVARTPVTCGDRRIGGGGVRSMGVAAAARRGFPSRGAAPPPAPRRPQQRGWIPRRGPVARVAVHGGDDRLRRRPRPPKRDRRPLRRLSRSNRAGGEGLVLKRGPAEHASDCSAGQTPRRAMIVPPFTRCASAPRQPLCPPARSRTGTSVHTSWGCEYIVIPPGYRSEPAVVGGSRNAPPPFRAGRSLLHPGRTAIRRGINAAASVRSR